MLRQPRPLVFTPAGEALTQPNQSTPEYNSIVRKRDRGLKRGTPGVSPAFTADQAPPVNGGVLAGRKRNNAAAGSDLRYLRRPRER